MPLEQIAKRLGLKKDYVSQVEMAALSKIHVLLKGEELDEGLITEPRELRMLVAQCRNALRKNPRHPRSIDPRLLSGTPTQAGAFEAEITVSG